MSGALPPVSYLGFVVGNGHRCPEECKVNSIKSLPIPRTKTQVRSFLGMTGYYCDFIPAYASHSYHLTEATKMDSEFCYLRNCLSSSQSL